MTCTGYEKTWTISDSDGSNKRTVTLAQFLAFNARKKHEALAAFKTELTPIGEQYVVPGCEKHIRPAGSQLKLWEA